MALEPHFIGADSGSTDPGPHYLGSGDTLFSDSAYKRDLRLMLLAGRAAKIPVIVGSVAFAGPSGGVLRARALVTVHEARPTTVPIVAAEPSPQPPPPTL